ncbi:hypothetical protein [Kitasatospora purpeofusca]
MASNCKDGLHVRGAEALSLARVLTVAPMVMPGCDRLLARRPVLTGSP